MKENYKQNIKIFIILISTAFLGYAMIIFSVDISVAVYNSIICCLTVIIPSLYGFLALASFLVKTNFYAIMSKPFAGLSRYVFRIPTELFSIFLISLFAGYPVGAKLIYELIEQNKISPKDAETMLCYCYASSPTFIIGLVGVKLFSSIKIGLYIYLSLILTNMILAIIIGLTKKIPPKTTNIYTIKINTKILISSIESGAKSLFQVCLMIVYFAIIIAILINIGLVQFLSKSLSDFSNIDINSSSILIKSILEISNLSSLPQLCFSYLPIITGVFSFGGICIILQVAALTKGKIKLIKFLIFRLISSIISAFICTIIFKTIGASLAVSVSNYPTIAMRHISPVPSIFLIIMTILLLSKKNTATN